MNKFDTVVTGCLDIAQSEALNRFHGELYAEHLLWGLLKNPASFSHKALKKVSKEVEQLLDNYPRLNKMAKIENIKPHSLFSEWLTYASSNAIQEGHQEITEKDLLKFMPKIFPALNVDYAAFTGEEEQELEVPKFLINLNELAQAGKLDPVIGRAKEIRAVMEILGRRRKNNPVLVGPAGVGKTAIIEGLAEAMVKGDVPEVLKGKTLYSLEMGALMAGTKFRGEFEERLQELLKFIKGQAGQSLLFIDEIHQLVGAGKTDGAMDAANLLKPALARGELHCIGATTNEEYQKYILGDSALDRRFRSVPVNAPSIEDSIEILMGIKEKMEIHHGVKISDEAIVSSVTLSDQYITDKNLPDKAIDLVDEAASALKLSAEAMPAELVEMQALIRSKNIQSQVDPKNKEIKKEILALEEKFVKEKESWEKEVFALKQLSELKNNLDRYKFELEQAERDSQFELASKLKYSLIPEVESKLEATAHEWVLREENIAMIISRVKGIPLKKILKSAQENILEIESYLKDQVFGQESAMHEVAETLMTSYAGLSDGTRPLGSFLLKGPSGVGKTQTAKALCQFLFNSENNLIRLDMSEYSEKHSVAKLIGAPAGYVGYEEGGILTEAVRLQPYAVILFDEIEKAHKDFADILLQVLDDGRLTDNKGRTIDFKNTIILLTTNSKDIEADFRPEVIGRLDSILTYNSLNENIMHKLIMRECELLNMKLAGKNIKIELDDRVISSLAHKGYDARYGARPMKNLFNKLIIRPLSKKILQGDLVKGFYHGRPGKGADDIIWNVK